MLERHREEDNKPIEADLKAKEVLRITRLKTDAAQLRQWLTDHPEDRKGSKGTIRKSNRTERAAYPPGYNESAKMATSKGVIQGYTGVAAFFIARRYLNRTISINFNTFNLSNSV